MNKQRLYGLFEKQPDGSWKRISDLAFTKPNAVRFWQGALLAHILSGAPERKLAPVKELA